MIKPAPPPSPHDAIWYGNPPRPPDISMYGKSEGMTTGFKVRIDFPLGSFYGDGKRVLGIDNINIRLGTSSVSTKVSVENTNKYGRRIEECFSEDAPPHNSPVYIWVVVNNESFIVFTGIITGVPKWNASEAQFTCKSILEKYRKKIGVALDRDTYPNLPDSSLGKIQPWVWGTVEGFKPVLYDDDQVTELSRALLSTDLTAHVVDASKFNAGGGKVNINDECIQYTATDTTDPDDHLLTGLTRGVNDNGGNPTKPGSHVKGNQVIESGELSFFVAEHSLNPGSITNVRYVSGEIEVPIDSSLFTINYAGPTTIIFPEAPTLMIPSNAHKLKFIDLDTDLTSTCTDPTYALGRHINWDEYNYAALADTEYLQAERDGSDPVVEPAGEFIRMWLVVEYLKNFTGNGAQVYFDSENLGHLPDKSNTPDDLKEDEGIHSMSAGFEDEHKHEMPNGEHQHATNGTGTFNIVPALDDGVAGVSGNPWGAVPDAYNGNWGDYAEVDLYNALFPKTDIAFHYLYCSEGLNLTSKITHARFRFKLGRVENPSGPTPAQGDYWVKFKMENSSPTLPDYSYTVGSGDCASLPKVDDAETPLELDSGWMDISTEELFTVDFANAKFVLESSSTTVPFAVYMMEVDFQVNADAENALEGFDQFSYEPCGHASVAGLEAAFDGDFSTWATIMYGFSVDFDWTSVSNPDAKINAIIVSIAGAESNTTATNTWQFYIAGSSTPWSFKGRTLGNTQTMAFLDLRSFNYTGADLLKSGGPGVGTFLRHNSISNGRTVEVGIWVLYENSGNSMTGLAQVGASDTQSGSFSSLAWFDLGDADSWQYPVDKPVKILCSGADNEVKVLRAFFAAEFAPRNKQIAREVLCDVVGRAGAFNSILEDVLTQGSLLGVPPSSVSVPAISRTGHHGLTDHVDGFAFLQRALNEATCHFFQSWDGTLMVKARPSSDAFPAAKHSILDADTIDSSMKDMSQMVNKLTVYYKFDYHKREYTESVVVEDTDSQAEYAKVNERDLHLDFIKTESEAEAIGNLALSYLKRCWREIPFEKSGLQGLSFLPGDVCAVNVDGIKGAKVEIKEARIKGVSDGMLSVAVKGTKYE